MLSAGSEPPSAQHHQMSPLQCQYNITINHCERQRQRRTDTYLCTDYGLLGCNLADRCQYYKEDGGSSCLQSTGIYPSVTWCHIPEVSLLWELQCQKSVAKSELNNNQHSYKIKPSWLHKVCLVREIVTHIEREQKATFQFKMTNGQAVSIKEPSPELFTPV